METIEYVYISSVYVFYVAKVQLSFTTMVGGDLLFVVGFVCSCKHQLQLNISCKDHLQMIILLDSKYDSPTNKQELKPKTQYKLAQNHVHKHKTYIKKHVQTWLGTQLSLGT
jgi:hypothetical protein